MNKLAELNDKKHLPPQEFDAELGALLAAQHDRRRADYEKMQQKSEPRPKAEKAAKK